MSVQLTYGAILYSLLSFLFLKKIYGPSTYLGAKSMVVRKYTPSEEQFFRSITPPFEDWLSTDIPPRLLKGAIRWFRSSNITPIEHWRRLNVQPVGTESRAS
jgi:hypothetical protein